MYIYVGRDKYMQEAAPGHTGIDWGGEMGPPALNPRPKTGDQQIQRRYLSPTYFTQLTCAQCKLLTNKEFLIAKFSQKGEKIARFQSF